MFSPFSGTRFANTFFQLVASLLISIMVSLEGFDFGDAAIKSRDFLSVGRCCFACGLWWSGLSWGGFLPFPHGQPQTSLAGGGGGRGHLRSHDDSGPQCAPRAAD